MNKAITVFLLYAALCIGFIDAGTHEEQQEQSSVMRMARQAAGKLGVVVGVMGPVYCALGYLTVLSMTEGCKVEYGRNMTAEAYARFVSKMDKEAQIAGSYLLYGATVCVALGYISYKYILPNKPKKKEPSVLPDHMVIPIINNAISREEWVEMTKSRYLLKNSV